MLRILSIFHVWKFSYHPSHILKQHCRLNIGRSLYVKNWRKQTAFFFILGLDESSQNSLGPPGTLWDPLRGNQSQSSTGKLLGIIVRATFLLNSDFNSSSGTLWDTTMQKILRFDPTLGSNNSGLKNYRIKNHHIFGIARTSAFIWHIWIPLKNFATRRDAFAFA